MHSRIDRHARWLFGVLFVFLVTGCTPRSYYGEPGSATLTSDQRYWYLDEWILSEDKQFIVVQYAAPSGTYRVYDTDALEELPFDDKVQEWMKLETNLRWEDSPFFGDRSPSPDGSLI